MLIKLVYDLTFASTGKTIKREMEFSKGLTGITGPNGTGKSLTIEMIRFCLWGGEALRSTKDSYKSLSAELIFKIADTEYIIYRSLNKATLAYHDKDGGPIASGTKPVNLAVGKLFGYDMTVFDTANAVLQGEVDALSRMKPSERKAMVDRTLGLDALDDMAKDMIAVIASDQKVLQSLAANVELNILEPEKPAGYDTPAKDLLGQVQKIEELVKEKYGIEQRLAVMKCEKPEEPKRLESESSEKLQAMIYEKSNLQSMKTRVTEDISVQHGRKTYELQFPEDQMRKYLAEGYADKWKSYEEYKKVADSWDGKNPPEWLTKELIERCLAKIAGDEIMELIKQAEEGSGVECPSCKTKFSLEQEYISKLKARLPNGYVSGVASPPELMTSKLCEEANKTLEVYTAFKALTPIVVPDLPNMGTRDKVDMALSILDGKKEAEENVIKLTLELFNIDEKLKPYLETDLVTRLADAKTDEGRSQQYKQGLERFNLYLEETVRTEARLKELVDVEQQKSDLWTRHNDAITYEKQLQVYQMKLDNNASFKAQMDEVTAKVEVNQRIRKALQEIKPKVKSYLLPSLNRVASNLVSQMTGGMFNHIQVDESFEIKVNNQDVSELSGSEKAVAILAVRIGLGTVLTNKIFSVLLADEVDAAMDPERAAFTATCLKNLTKAFDQVILVSHREPEADNKIKL